ncbi:MAG: peptidase [Rhodoferax sp.]|nr:MAG: peptidase [Rhodoferax sp.]
MPQQITQTTQLLPAMLRAAQIEPSSFNADKRTVEVVFTTGAKVRRYDYWRERWYDEELVVSEDAVDLTRMNAGASVLNTHGQYDLNDVIGVVESAWIAGTEGRASVRLSDRPEMAGIVADIQAGVIRHISAGYSVQRMEVVRPEERTDGGVDWLYRAVRWTPAEISFVPVPADAGSGTRSKPEQGTQPCEFITRAAAQIQENPMPQGNETGGATATPASETRANPAPASAQVVDTQDLIARSAEISELCARHGMAHMAADFIRSGSDVGAAKSKILDALATRDAAAGGHRNVGTVVTVKDEMQVRMAGIEQAILHRVAPATTLDDNGRQYRGMSLLEIGRGFLEAHGVRTSGMDRLQLATQILHFRAGSMGTSDFSSLFANVANKRLRSAYDENPGTYAMWARRAPNAPDFKNMSVVQLSGAPDLLQTNEHGEFKYGKMTDGAESYAVLTYGRIVSLTRQAIINDDLRAFERLVSAFGFAARRLENRTVYSQLTANGNLADGGALFNATAITTAGGHANLATGAPSALQLSSLTTGRTAMRLQKGLASEELNLAPSYLIVPAALEQTAYQLTSSNYVPAQQSNVNEFRTGGRTALEPIVEPILDANSATAWYLAAQSSQVDTVEYCYLDGAEGPVIESEVGFETDGVAYKCRLDFAAKAIDFRGLYKSAGA